MRTRVPVNFYAAMLAIALSASAWIYYTVREESSVSETKNKLPRFLTQLKENQGTTVPELLMEVLSGQILLMEPVVLRCFHRLSRSESFDRKTVGKFCSDILWQKNSLTFGIIGWEKSSLSKIRNWASKNEYCVAVGSCRTATAGSGNHCQSISKCTKVIRPDFPTQIVLHRPLSQQVIILVILHDCTEDLWVLRGFGQLFYGTKDCSNISHIGSGFLIKDGDYRIPKSVTSHITLDRSREKYSFLIPGDLLEFLELTNAPDLYIPCNQSSVNIKKNVQQSSEYLLFRSQVKKCLKRVKIIFDYLEIPFWISSGTSLGWFRECDIIPHSQDVDIGVFVRDYSDDITQQFFRRGFELVYRLGTINDSLQLCFVMGETKIDIYFFYEEADYMWNGATAYKAGQKFKYQLWSKQEMTVRVPCNPLQYIVANYGSNWSRPVFEWDWRISPPNAINNGFWTTEERERAIYLNPTYFREDYG